MRAVIYTYDMEPVTIILLPFELKRLKYPVYSIAVPPDPLTEFSFGNKPSKNDFKTVDIKVEILHKHGKQYPMFFVDEDQLTDAFKLHPSFLPGQQDYIEHYENQIKILSGLLIYKIAEKDD